jgi:simple sugar transport system ATP-binding protein
MPTTLARRGQDVGRNAVALAVRALTTEGSEGRIPLTGIALEVEAGTICGIAGVDGNGQEELAAALYGLAGRRGEVAVEGVAVPPHDVTAAQRAGLNLIPADRRRDGLALGLPVWENAVLSAVLLERFTRGGMLDVRRARAFASALVREYGIVLAALEQEAATLSGGNQQRLVIGRALAVRPTVLVAVNPTRGLDIAATTYVHATLARVARAGTAVLLISTDLDELTTLCDRLFALFRGQLRGPVSPGDRARLGALMAGIAA